MGIERTAVGTKNNTVNVESNLQANIDDSILLVALSSFCPFIEQYFTLLLY